MALYPDAVQPGGKQIFGREASTRKLSKPPDDAVAEIDRVANSRANRQLHDRAVRLRLCGVEVVARRVPDSPAVTSR
jgi:hypothetical protein